MCQAKFKSLGKKSSGQWRWSVAIETKIFMLMQNSYPIQEASQSSLSREIKIFCLLLLASILLHGNEILWQPPTALIVETKRHKIFNYLQSMDYALFLKCSTLTQILYGILTLEDICLFILLIFFRLGQHDCVLAGCQRIVLISISNFRHLSRLHGYVHRVSCSLVSEQNYDTLHLSSSFPLGFKHMAM